MEVLRGGEARSSRHCFSLYPVERQRQEDQPFLDFAARIAKRQASRQSYFVIEQPRQSQALKEPQIQELRAKYGEVVLDMCTQGLKDPYIQEPLRKPTMITWVNQIELAPTTIVKEA